MTKFTSRSLTSCVPICRSELFEDVSTKKDTNQPVSKVWLVPGHVFVSLNNGNKLITFDCKPVIHHHNVGASTLDFPVLKPAVMDIFIHASSPNFAYIVQQNGHVHCWQYTSSFQWASVMEFNLGESTESEIISVCLHSNHNAFYWCERLPTQDSAHRICTKMLSENLQDKNEESHVDIIQDSPPADLLPLNNGLLIVPRYLPNQTRVWIFWRPSVLGLVSVATVIGDTVTDHHDMRSPLAFADILLSCLADLSQAVACVEDYGAKNDSNTNLPVLLHSDGTVQKFHMVDGNEGQSVSVSSVKVAMPEQLLQIDNPKDAWTVHKNILAIATAHNTVGLYSVTEGHLIHELELTASLHNFVSIHSPLFVVAMVTSSGVTVVQGGKGGGKNTESQSLPTDKHFQTDALQVALLMQQREEDPGQHISDQLTALHSKWKDFQAHQPRSQLSDTVDSYLTEFWRLEEQANQLGMSQQTCPLSADYGTREMVQEAVIRSRGMAPDAAMAELMWLSRKYPEDMLHILLGDLDVEKGELTAEEQALWQSTLGLESVDGHLHMHYHTITFELVCRLLYQERPQALVSFVRNTQAVSEQAVGVSAFVRRKHMRQYYVRAMECLPEPNHSKHPAQAASAKAEIILLGATERGAELALRFLLRHNQWSRAVGLLQQLGPGAPQHTSLFFLLLQHLLQGQALSSHASEVFSLLSSWKSFLPAMKVMSEKSSWAKDAAFSPSLFYSGSPDIPLSALRSHLMALLTSSKKQ